MPKSFLILVIFLMVLWHSTVSFAGPPLLPAAFYGTIIRDDPSTPPADMVVVAAIDDIEFARGAIFQNGEEWVYSLKVPADNPSTEAIDGGRPGDTVTFSIGGESLGQATWEGGSNTQVDLVLSPVEAAAPDESAVSPSWSPQWMPWLLILLALMLVGAAWLLFIRPRLRKT